MAKFKTRARTVDMLGRQQIANISTAISELFKNAYDAYAEHAEVDYFRSDDLLVIRDDGFGMTPEEFENKWLVLGTESKYGPANEHSVYKPVDKPLRAIMGEKGIGRLAIALLGRQVLVMTRAERDGKLHDLVMCFIHWGLFELPGVNLDDIALPIKCIEGGRLPTLDEVKALLDELKVSLYALDADFEQENLIEITQSDTETENPSHPSSNSEQRENRELRNVYLQEIRNDVDDFQLDPEDINEFLGGINLCGNGSGTHFYIAPADDSIAYEIDNEQRNNTKDFSKFLLGFSNSVFCESTTPPIVTAFRDWHTDAFEEDLIGAGEFFTREELDNADHRISGKIDEFGQFLGNIRIYEDEVKDYVIAWKEGHGKPTRCGPFEIEFGYVPGSQRESRLPPEEWKRIVDKLNDIGGIYVYRDRIRILPYGNSDVDWLNIEERRSKSAAYYFFSHRRIFGAVTLTRKQNALLKEKAGREGFQQDKAYRQLKEILQNLFMQLAADFFRESGNYSEYFAARKAELEKLELARRKREKQVSTKRRNLAASLDSFFQRVNERLPNIEIDSLRDSIKQQMTSAAAMKDPDEASIALLTAEKEANRKLAELRSKYAMSKPRGVGLSITLQREWEAYTNEQERLEKELFSPFGQEVAQTLGVVAREAKLYVDQRRRLNDLIKQQAETESKAVRQEAGGVRNSADNTRVAALRCAKEAIQDLQKTISSVEAEFAAKDLTELSEDEIEEIRFEFESRIEKVGKKNTEILSQVRDMLTTISSNLENKEAVMQTDILEAMDQELQGLREQADTDAELVQLGLAVAVINHEFEASIKGVRRSLRELKPWASSNDELSVLYQQIRTNFEHLDGHLNLFTPLQRRLYRKAIDIEGSEINHYIQTLFNVRFKRHNITLNVTNNFLNSKTYGFPSTLYPVFVNILDNAIFWLKNNKEEKTITLDADSQSFLIFNNGPAIPKRDYEAIFEQGFTRKPGGRGLGLFISKKALKKEGMDIVIVPSDNQQGVTLRILWAKQDEES